MHLSVILFYYMEQTASSLLRNISFLISRNSLCVAISHLYIERSLVNPHNPSP